MAKGLTEAVVESNKAKAAAEHFRMTVVDNELGARYYKSEFEKMDFYLKMSAILPAFTAQYEKDSKDKADAQMASITAQVQAQNDLSHTV